MYRILPKLRMRVQFPSPAPILRIIFGDPMQLKRVHKFAGSEFGPRSDPSMARARTMDGPSQFPSPAPILRK